MSRKNKSINTKIDAFFVSNTIALNLKHTYLYCTNTLAYKNQGDDSMIARDIRLC